jgi:hypothetical protein
LGGDWLKGFTGVAVGEAVVFMNGFEGGVEDA